jgi:hypothetical protein
MVDSRSYKARAEACCRNASEARSIVEKEIWLRIAENWLILARRPREAALQKIERCIEECVRASRDERSHLGSKGQEPSAIDRDFERSALSDRVRALQSLVR